MRCLALGQAWKDAGGKVIFISDCTSEGLLDRLAEEAFKVHHVARLYPAPEDWTETEKILARHPEAWVILDGYHFDEAYQQRIKRSGHRLLAIDDMAHLKHYYADIILNQNLGAEVLSYSYEPYTRLLLGTNYVLLRHEFLKWKTWKRIIPETARHLVITMGGSDPQNYTLKAVQALRNVNIPGLEAAIVIGASNPHVDILEEEIRKTSVNARILKDARNMPELMAWADIAVASAGSTVWELAFMGLPAILVVLAENQRSIAESLEKSGAAINLGWASQTDTGDISDVITVLMTQKTVRRRMSQKGRKLVDGKGAQRVVSLLLTEGKYAHSLSG